MILHAPMRNVQGHSLCNQKERKGRDEMNFVSFVIMLILRDETRKEEMKI